jgi:uridine monophosphate synthetase
MSNEFWNRLAARSSAISSLLCVGLDPTVADLTSAKLLTADRTPAAAALEFCKRLVVATAPYAAAFKPNSAFFEAFGPEGFAALIELHRFIKHDVPGNIPILLDVKRGDIATTADAYATASFHVLDADAVTLNAYMGVDALTPFLSAEGGKRGVFVLCKTSNKSADEIQTLQLKPSATLPSGTGGMQVYEAVAHHSTRLWAKGGYKIGLVVGATDPVALAAVRKIAPTSWILAPGIGAQGGDLERALEAGLTADGSGLLLPISRGISKAEDPAHAAETFQKQINALVAGIIEKRAAARGSSSSALRALSSVRTSESFCRRPWKRPCSSLAASH